MFLAGTEGVAQPLDKARLWSETFKDFLSQCLQVDPAKRASPAQLLEVCYITLLNDVSKYFVMEMSLIFCLFSA